MDTERPILFDGDIRILLFDYLDENYGKIRTFEEKTVGNSRSDVLAVIPEKIIGIEIKSDADTYTRLKTQVSDYDKYCDLCYILVGSSHLRHAAQHVPLYWGILYADQTEAEPIIRSAREALPNPKVRLKNQLKLLWRRELRQLTVNNRLPKYDRKTRAFVTKMLVDRVSPDKLKAQICDALFERDYTLL